MNFLDACRALIGVESTPGHGTRAVAELAGRLCADAGLHVELIDADVDGVAEASVVARSRPGRPARELLLQTRLDTAAAGHYGRWTKTQANPFRASIYGDVMYGLGTADVKLDFACKLEAARSFAGRDLTLPFALAGTFGGPRGSAGAVDLIRDGFVRPVFALVGEPTELGLHGAGAGFASVEISIPFSEEERAYRRDHDLLESTSTQSRVFNSGGGGNALASLFAYLAQLPAGLAIMDLDGGGDARATPAQAVLELDAVGGFADPILPKITAVIAAIDAVAYAMSAVRDEAFEPAHATFGVRAVRTTDVAVVLKVACVLPPGVAESAFETWVRPLRATCVETSATFSVTAYRGGFKSDPDGAFVQAAQDILADMGLDSCLSKQAVTSEANAFSQLGIECVAWGPGRGFGNAHAPDEHVGIGELKSAVTFYRRMIERFCP